MPSDAAQRRRAVYEYNRFNRDRWVEDCAASVQPGKDVLDVGAGVAPYRQLFAHCSYKAQDFGQEPATIGHYTPLDFESDITSIPAPDASFDVILCTEVIEHVPDPAAAVAEMARLLRPGGRLFLSAPLGSLLHQQPYHYYGGYTPFWYERVLPQFGLRILSIQRNGGFFQWFAQEALRFSAYLNPRRTGSVPFARRAGLTVLWAALLPITRGLLPRIARSLDTLNLESIATAGYHVVAVKAA